MKFKYITRIDSLNTHGWWVRMSRFKIKKQKFFADLSYQSKDWALVKAMIFADESLESLSKQALAKKFSTDGTYVNHFGWTAKMKFKKDNRYKNSCGYFEVRWGYHKDVRTKYFSVKKLGYDSAEQKARVLCERLNENRFKKIEEHMH